MSSSNVMVAMKEVRDTSNAHFLKAMKLAIAILATTQFKNVIRKDSVDGDGVAYNGKLYVNNVMENEPDELAIVMKHKDGGYVEVGMVSTSYHIHHLNEDWELTMPKGVRGLTAFLLNRKKIDKAFHRRFDRAVLAYWFTLTA